MQAVSPPCVCAGGATLSTWAAGAEPLKVHFLPGSNCKCCMSFGFWCPMWYCSLGHAKRRAQAHLQTSWFRGHASLAASLIHKCAGCCLFILAITHWQLLCNREYKSRSLFSGLQIKYQVTFVTCQSFAVSPAHTCDKLVTMQSRVVLCIGLAKAVLHHRWIKSAFGPAMKFSKGGSDHLPVSLPESF